MSRPQRSWEGVTSGPIPWMTRNAVAANLLMAVLVIGGLVMARGVKQEVFPEFTMEFVRIQVVYPGASPSEVEQGIVLAIEEAVRGVDGVKRVTSGASEGSGSVWVELQLGADQDRVTADVKNAVDRIQSFPDDAERPIVSQLSNRREVVSVAIYGDVSDRILKDLGETFRDRVLDSPNVTLAEISGVRATEISIEVPQDTLRTHGLTLEGIARTISQTAVQIPAGSVKTPGGDVLLRTDERRDLGREFEDIAVVSGPMGADVRLGDIATIVDGFADVDKYSLFDGKPAVVVNVMRVGDQTPLTVAASVLEARRAFDATLPAGVATAVTSDWSEAYRDRMQLLLDNAFIGFFLVLLVLALFLELRLALWVTLGIPISFAGAMILLPAAGVSINMISLFAFIVTLGLVVDDAIVVGENIFEHRARGRSWMEASIVGAQEVSQPVIFAVLTTIVAFLPMFLVPGFMGKLFGVIPSVVVSVLLISLVESLFVLPAHLSHEPGARRRGVIKVAAMFFGVLLLPLRPLLWLLEGLRRICSGALQWWIDNPYQVILTASLRWRYATVAVGFMSLLTCIGFIAGGHIDFSFMPRIESDRVTARALLPFGTAAARTADVQDRLIVAAKQAFADLGGEDEHSRGIYAQLGTGIPGGGPVSMTRDLAGGHLTSVQVRLVESGLREFSATQFADAWRAAFGEPLGLDVLTFNSSLAAGGGSAVDVQLRHRDIRVLERAAKEVAGELSSYTGVFDIDTGFSRGKPQIDLAVREDARSLGVSTQDLARQARSAFFGAEAVRQQRGRDEVRVYVRLPKSERVSEHDVEELLVRTPRGHEVPLGVAAHVERGYADTSISRTDGSRAINVTADVDQTKANANKVLASLRTEFLPVLVARHAGLSYSLEGENREQAEAMKNLGAGYVIAMIIIFALLAVPFGSYIQPIVVMVAIPFGILGAVIGHLLMGFELSVISMMGIVALSGVVVNDSLVLVVAANRFRADGEPTIDAIRLAAMRRFRPILLTSLTTFFGLLPMIFETSVQARFLIPMAVSLGYGVLFVTFIVLGLVPSLYLIVEDGRHLMGLPDRYAREDDADLDGGPLDGPAPADETLTDADLAPA